MAIIEGIITAVTNVAQDIFGLGVAGTNLGTVFDIGLIFLFGMGILTGSKWLWDKAFHKAEK